MRLKIHLWICTVIFLLPVSLFGENSPNIEYLTSHSGLSHNTIRCMIQDKTGFMWFGSLNGLNRYDGVNITSFIPDSKNPSSLSSGKVKEIHQDSYGHIWVRTYSDIMHCYDPNTEDFIPLSDKNDDQFIKHNLYYEDKQMNVWLGSVSDGCVKISFDNGNAAFKTFIAGNKPENIPSNAVNDIFQDSYFNTWLMTAKGIALVKDNKVINLNKGKNSSVNFIKAFELKNKVYFLSDSGILKTYNLTSNKFEGDFAMLPSLKVFQAATMGDDKIVISTYNKGVYIFDQPTGKFTSGEAFFGDKITGNAYFQTNQFGDVLTYNFTGYVWLWSQSTSKMRKLNLIPSYVLQLIDEERYQFLGDKFGNIWITTYGNGLFCYNTLTENLDHFVYAKNSNGLSSNFLLSIVLDKNENIWVGTENLGVNKLSFSNRNVQIFYPDSEKVFRNRNVIKSFMEDKDHNIWVSTKAGNLYMYDSTLSVKKTIYENSYNVYSMYQDNNSSIWLATKKSGIIELKNGNPAKAIHYINSEKPGSLSNNTVFSLLKDKKGRVWAATFGGGVSVKTATDGTDGFQSFFQWDDWVRFTRYIFMDSKGEIWVATTNGVLRFDPDELLQNPKSYKHYSFSQKNKLGLSNPEIRYIFQDSKDSLWFATAGGGINKFIGETPQGDAIFNTYNNKQSLANDNIMAIQEDKSGCLWISTESGLQKFNMQTNLFQYYKFSNDFTSNLFSEAACLTSKNGNMFWGSLNGFYVFNPKNLQVDSQEKNTVVLTGFSIYDQKAKIAAKDAPLKKSISFSGNIVLKASDKVFHIEFANLNFRDPKSNQFMYMLENFEKRWNMSGAVNVATYRNVPPGEYTFLVKSVNSEGVWDDNVTKLEIKIQPPFWLTDFAIILYLLIFSGVIYFAVRIITNFNNLNNTVKIERQLTDYKLRFFTNISHEFRTPLTLIKGNVDILNDIKSKMSVPFQHLVVELDKNTTHLMRLIDQLLEFRKLQNNKQKLNLQKTDAVIFLKDIFTSFSNVASKTNIDYQYLTSHSILPIYLDQNKVDKIVFNLLSNAFKFTQRGGKISLLAEADYDAKVLRISVRDNGIGIPKEKQNLLFSRFMQINFSATGTGIGLSLVNEFTTMHKGTVRFKENEGGGSVFLVEFSLDENTYDKDDFVGEQVTVLHGDKKEMYNLSEFIQQNDTEVILDLVPNVPTMDKKYKILVIDDNDDIRDFLENKLSPYFEIITAEDGNTGIKKGMEDDPDLIICDVMMPGLNGFELTKKLKDDFATCHIPVILLTAYVSDDLNSEGIVAGADSYISKPFSMKHLLLQINKLLEKREMLHKHYGAVDSVVELKEQNALELPERDNQFLILVEEILENHLTNPSFSVDDFALMANTGRTLFFKKIKYLTGYTPNDFIRVRRMKKAAELLKTFKYNISEVSYMVGINDPFYFSKCFKAQFGCSPSKYVNS
jgi:signal transduction histidine kinase/ligand-binding sensor domain-containing protein/DNA-binding response OmpR family regulator